MAGFSLTAAVDLKIKNVSEIKRQFKQEFAGTNIQVTATTSGFQKSTAEIKRLEQEAKKVARTLRGAEDHMAAFGQQTGLAAKRFTAFVTGTLIMRRFGNAIEESFSSAIEFEKELVKVSQTTGTSLNSLKGLTSEVNRLSTSFGLSARSLLETSRILVQTGLSAKDTTTVLRALAKTELSPSFNNLRDSGEGVIAMMRQFRISADEVESKLSSINAVSKAFAVESEDIITAIRRTGGAFEAAGGNIEELIALFTSVRATTRESAESIATGFRTIFTRIQRTRTLDFLETLGVKLRDASGQFVKPFEAIKRLSEALQGLETTDPRFAQIIEELGGFRQVSKVIPLIKEFGTAQQALNVAQRGTDSLNKDVSKSQSALGRSFAKTREEFDKMIRGFSEDSGIRTLIAVVFKFTNAMIRLADAIRPIVPVLGLLFAARGASLAGSFFKGVTGGGPKKATGLLGGLGFASGGTVPGSGNSDTVPALLTPGEFVINKKAVQNIGVGRLKSMNNVQKFATGGLVTGDVKAGQLSAKVGKDGPVTLTDTTRGDKVPTFVEFVRNKLLVRNKNYAPLVASKLDLKIPLDNYSAASNEKIASFYDAEIENIINASSEKISEVLEVSSAPIKTTLLKNAGFKESVGGFVLEGIIAGISKKAARGGKAPLDFILGPKQAQRLGEFFTPDPSDARGFDAKRTERGGNVILNKALRNIFDPEVTEKFDTKFARKHVFSKNNLNGLAESLTEAEKSKFDKTLSRKQKVQQFATDIARPGKVKKVNTGGIIPGSGNSDTVPALLTPGEFVINKKSAKKIGFDSLKRLNRFASGGPVRKYQTGGAVTPGFGNTAFSAIVLTQLVQSLGETNDELGKFAQVISSVAVQALALSAAFKSYGDLPKLGAEITKTTEDIAANRQKFETLSGPQGKQGIEKTRATLLSQQGSLITQGAGLVRGIGQAKSINDTDKVSSLQKELTKVREEYAKTGKSLIDLDAAAVDNVIALNETEFAHKALNKTLADQQKEYNRLNRAINIASVGISLMSAAAAYFTQEAQKDLQAGRRSGVQKAGAGAGLGSAANVLSIGAGVAVASGPAAPYVLAGTVVAAVAVGLFSYSKAIKEAESQLRQVEFEKAAEKMAKNLEAINQGTISAFTGAGRVRSDITLSNKALREATTPEEVENATARIQQQIPAIQGFIQKTAESSKTLDQFKRTTGDTLDLYARFTGIFLPDLITQYEKQIKTQNEAAIKQEEFSKSISDFNRNATLLANLASALTVVTTKVSDFSKVVGAITGEFDTGLRDNSAIFSNIGKFGDQTLFNNALNTVSNIIGPSGNNALQQASIANRAGIAIPGLLTSVAAGTPIDAEGTFERVLDSKLKGLLGVGGNADVIRKTILNSVSDIIGSEGKDANIIEEIRKNLPEVTEKINKSLQIFGDALTNTAKALTEIENSYSQGLAKVSELRTKVVQGQLSLIDKQQQVLEIFQGFDPLGRKQFFNLEGRRQSIIQGTTGTLDPATLLSNILAASNREVGIQGQLDAGVGNRQDLLNARQAEIDIVKRSTEALEFLADTGARTRDSLAELALENERQKAKVDLTQSFAFGTSQERNQIGKNIVNAVRLARGESIDAIRGEDRSGVLSILRQFGDTKLDSLGGRSGNDVIVQATLAKLQRENPGADPKFLQELAGALSTDKQQELQKEIRDAALKSLEAQETLNKLNETRAETLLKTNSDGFKSVVASVGQVVATLERERIQQTRDQLAVEGNKLAAARDILPALQQAGFQTRNNPLLGANLVEARDIVKEREKLIAQQLRFDRNLFVEAGLARNRAELGDNALSNIQQLSAGLSLSTGIDQTKIADQLKSVQTGGGLDELLDSFLATKRGGDLFAAELKKRGQENLPGRTKNAASIRTFFGRQTETVFVVEALKDLLSPLTKQTFTGPIAEFNRQLANLSSNPAAIQKASANTGEFLTLLNNAIPAFENINANRIEENFTKVSESIRKFDVQLNNAANNLPQQQQFPLLPGQNPVQRNSGGLIPGFGNSDTVPAMLTPGEFVINKRSVQRIGLAKLFELNKFADGGLVDRGDLFKRLEEEKEKARKDFYKNLIDTGGFKDKGFTAETLENSAFDLATQFAEQDGLIDSSKYLASINRYYANDTNKNLVDFTKTLNADDAIESNKKLNRIRTNKPVTDFFRSLPQAVIPKVFEGVRGLGPAADYIKDKTSEPLGKYVKPILTSENFTQSVPPPSTEGIRAPQFNRIGNTPVFPPTVGLRTPQFKPIDTGITRAQAPAFQPIGPNIRQNNTQAVVTGGNLEAAVNKFNSSSNQLASTLSAFPSEVTHSINGSLEVIINGAQVVAEIMPGLQKYINTQIVESVNRIVKDKFPEIA